MMARRAKALLRTVEAILAIAITMIVLNFAIPEGISPQKEENLNVLKNLEHNDDFRRCALQRNSTCLNSTFASQIPNNLEFAFNVSSQASAKTALPSNKRVFSDSLFISGNGTHYMPTVVRLYYWSK